jgi:hypothetical protein
MLRNLFGAVALTSAAATAAAQAQVLLHEDFQDYSLGSVNLTTSDPEWRASHRTVVVSSAQGNNFIHTSWDTAWHLIGAQFSGDGISLSQNETLRITIDYDASHLGNGGNQRTSRVLFGLQGGSPWDPLSHPIAENGSMSNVSVFDSNPETHYTADWFGYQAELRVDNHPDHLTRVWRNDGPFEGLGSVWFRNNALLDTADSYSVAGWRSAQLSLRLDGDNNVVVELREGEDRNNMALISSIVDNSPNRITSGFQHVALGATNSGIAVPDGNPHVWFDNITVELAMLRLMGDANLDGRVDIADLGILAANWQATGTTWEQGDFNEDGVVDIADLGILAGNWQAGVNFAEALAKFDAFEGVVIPEPGSIFLLGLGAVLLRRRGRIRS